MNTTVEALKEVYMALGGSFSEVENCSTNVEVLNAISAKYDGEANATLNSAAVMNIAAIAGSMAGGGSFEGIEAYKQVSSSEMVVDSLKGEPLAYMLMRCDAFSTSSSKQVISMYKIEGHGIDTGYCVATDSSKGKVTEFSGSSAYADGALTLNAGAATFGASSHYILLYLY